MDLLLSKNLHNLGAFWSALKHREVKTTHGATGEIDTSNIHTGWPNKQWRADFSLPDSLDNGRHTWVSIVKPSNASKVEVKFSLSTMVLSLPQVVGEVSTHVESITRRSELTKWAHACSDAFNYDISPDAIEPLINDANATIFSYKLDGDIAGTAIVYQTGTVFGVHQLGVVPKFQGAGVAKLMMLHLIEFAKQKGGDLMTLQSSQAGFKLYTNLGFVKLGDIHHLEHQ